MQDLSHVVSEAEGISVSEMLEKGSPKWNAFADAFLMYRTLGNPQNRDEWGKLVREAERITEKFKGTDAQELAKRLCLTICDVIDDEQRKGSSND